MQPDIVQSVCSQQQTPELPTPKDRGFSLKGCAGLFHRRSCWVPTARGWLLLLVSGAGLAAAAFFGLDPFLAVNKPVKAEILVVEGWVADYALQFTAREFRAQPYSRLYVTGGPLAKGWYLAEYKTFAELGAATLRQLGVASNVVVAVPAPQTRMDRTYQSALILRKRLEEAGQSVKSLNLVTVGAHARRSQLLFERAFGNRVKVGVIAVPPADYDSGRWWRFSQGWRDVIGESVGYVYALCSI